MRKFFILILAVCMFFVGCENKDKEEKEFAFSEIEDIFLKALDSDFGYCTVTDYYVSNYFSDFEGVRACEIYKSNDSVNFDEFGIFEFESDSIARKNEELLKQYIDKSKGDFLNGIVYNAEEYPKFRAADTLVCGKYLVYGILSPDVIESILNELKQK